MVIYSDIHVGSKVAVCSESPKIVDGQDYVPTKLQKALFKAWKETPKYFLQKSPDVIVLNGECVDGINKRSFGSGSWSMDLNDQIRDFEKIIKHIPKPKHYVVTRGSNYHVTTDGATNLDELVAEKIQATRYRTHGGSGYSDYEANIEINGKYFNFTHHVGFAEWQQYRTTSLARELVKLHFEHEKRGFHTDIAVRSHVHYYVEVRFKSTCGFTNPSWKLADSFMYRRGIPTTSDIGCVEVLIESNGQIIINPIIAEIEINPEVLHL